MKELQALGQQFDEAVRLADGDRATHEQSPDGLGHSVSVPGAWADIIAERRRQIEAEGWTLEHDDEHSFGELAYAAATYAGLAGAHSYIELHHSTKSAARWSAIYALWPFYGQPKTADKRRMLVKAGALVLAEIERLDRVSEHEDRHS